MLWMEGGAAILEKWLCTLGKMEMVLEIEHIEIIFRSEHACQHRTNSLDALLCIQEEILPLYRTPLSPNIRC